MAEPDLTLPPQEAGFLFRAEMAATNFLLGYWRHMLVVVGVVLAVILVYGQWQSMTRRTQRAFSAQIAEAWSDIPPEAVPGQLTSSQEATIREVADKLVALGANFRGPAVVDAGLRAAELYRVLGDAEGQRKALEMAVPYAEGPLLYAARTGLANLDLQAGDVDAAVATWRDLMDTMDGWLAEEAALSLAGIYAHEGRDADARSVYVEFQSRWPESPRQGEVAEKLAMLDARAAGGAAPAPEPAPTEPAPTEPAPTEPAPTEGAPE